MLDNDKSTQDTEATDSNNEEQVDTEVEKQEEETSVETDEKLFTQAELEQKIRERLAREKRKAEREIEEARREAERQKNEEDGNYKELYESLQTELSALKEEKALQERHDDLVSRLKKLGLNDEQASKGANRLSKYVTDDDIDTEVADYADDIKNANIVDPSPGVVGNRKVPTPQDDADYGNKMLEAVRGLKRTKFN